MVRSPTAFNTNMSVEKEFSLSKLHEGMSFARIWFLSDAEFEGDQSKLRLPLL